jgi:16S rRNA (guanine527-N7)-methyltransferase
MQDWLINQGYGPLTEEQLNLFDLYQRRLLEVNEYMNLTAITSDEDIAVKHFIDSFTLLPWLGTPGIKLLDIGAGAGFPGLALKIIKPDVKITLMDSLRKRVLFLRETADMLGLTDVECQHARAEEFSRKPEYRMRYDIVTARAVASLTKLVRYALPFLKKGGLFLAMKGPEVGKEIAEALPAIKKHGCAVREVREVYISGEIKRTVIVVER